MGINGDAAAQDDSKGADSVEHGVWLHGAECKADALGGEADGAD